MCCSNLECVSSENLVMRIGVKIGTDPPQELHYQLDTVEAAGLPFRLARPRTIQLQNRLIWQHHQCSNVATSAPSIVVAKVMMVDRRAGSVAGKAMRVGHMRLECNRLLFCERVFKH